MAAAPRSNLQQRRLVRTIVLGTVAVVAGIAWLAGELGMDKEELLDFAGTSVLLVGAMVVLALLGAAVLRVLKKLFGRD
ncbi:MAG: hypothetical protein U5Q16_14940 [Gammaproteobacteria bacterium]|nr:hypothetical protein [Gammaproteobacteria bacterium]